MKSSAQSSRPNLRHHIYVITGPSGSYVGCSANAEVRRKSHLWQARSANLQKDCPVHVAMRTDGAELYAFEVVAACRNYADGIATERAVMAQLAGEGARMLNEHGVPLAGPAMTMGERIRHAREAKGVSQVGLAKILDIPAQSLWRIESGDVLSPRVELLAKIAAELGMTLDDLVRAADPAAPGDAA